MNKSFRNISRTSTLVLRISNQRTFNTLLNLHFLCTIALNLFFAISFYVCCRRYLRFFTPLISLWRCLRSVCNYTFRLKSYALYRTFCLFVWWNYKYPSSTSSIILCLFLVPITINSHKILHIKYKFRMLCLFNSNRNTCMLSNCNIQLHVKLNISMW